MPSVFNWKAAISEVATLDLFKKENDKVVLIYTGDPTTQIYNALKIGLEALPVCPQ